MALSLRHGKPVRFSPLVCIRFPQRSIAKKLVLVAFEPTLNMEVASIDLDANLCTWFGEQLTSYIDNARSTGVEIGYGKLMCKGRRHGTRNDDGSLYCSWTTSERLCYSRCMVQVGFSTFIHSRDHMLPGTSADQISLPNHYRPPASPTTVSLLPSSITSSSPAATLFSEASSSPSGSESSLTFSLIFLTRSTMYLSRTLKHSSRTSMLPLICSSTCLKVSSPVDTCSVMDISGPSHSCCKSTSAKSISENAFPVFRDTRRSSSALQQITAEMSFDNLRWLFDIVFSGKKAPGIGARHGRVEHYIHSFMKIAV
jgi:hypothetical protein